MDNPWIDLPDVPQFVLPSDLPHVKAFNEGAHRKNKLDLSVLPQPFLGRRDAKLVVLGRNPGRRGWTIEPYAEALKEDLKSPNGTPLPPLRTEFVEDDGQWWGRCLKEVLKDTGNTSSWLAERVLSVEFHGYHSESYRAIPMTLPSQTYGFWLVEKAVNRGATVVIMRGERDWKIAVPSLRKAKLVLLRNPQSATISPGNCGLAGFRRVLTALEHKVDRSS